MSKFEIPEDATEKMKSLIVRYNYIVDVKRSVIKKKPVNFEALDFLGEEIEMLIYRILTESIIINKKKKAQSTLDEDIDKEIQKRI